MKNPQYHICIIGPIDRDELDKTHPNGEGCICAYNKEAFFKVAGHYANTCASGWGVTPEIEEEIHFAWNNEDTKKRIIRSYLNEEKPFPTKLHEAYHLLMVKNGEML